MFSRQPRISAASQETAPKLPDATRTLRSGVGCAVKVAVTCPTAELLRLQGHPEA